MTSAILVQCSGTVLGTLSTDDDEPRGRLPEVKFLLSALLRMLARRPREVQDVKTSGLPSRANVSAYVCIYVVFEAGNLYQTIEMKGRYLLNF